MSFGALAQAGAPDVPHRGLITTVVMMATAMHALDATIAEHAELTWPAETSGCLALR